MFELDRVGRIKGVVGDRGDSGEHAVGDAMAVWRRDGDDEFDARYSKPSMDLLVVRVAVGLPARRHVSVVRLLGVRLRLKLKFHTSLFINILYLTS